MGATSAQGWCLLVRLRLAAVTTAMVVLIGLVGAPVVPVMIGATAAYAWLLWR